MKKTLIIYGHPNRKSYCYALAEAYRKGAESSNVAIKELKLIDLEFNPNLLYGYQKRTELEPDLVKAQELITWAEHLVIVYPVWWGSMPAILKGFFDRVLLPGFAFKYHEKDPFWDKHLKGKSARVICTLHTPIWYHWLVYGTPPHKIMKRVILNFCGIKPVKTSVFAVNRDGKGNGFEKFLKKVEGLGRKLK